MLADRPIAHEVFVNVNDWQMGPRSHLSRARAFKIVNADGGGCRLKMVQTSTAVAETEQRTPVQAICLLDNRTESVVSAKEKPPMSSF